MHIITQYSKIDIGCLVYEKTQIFTLYSKIYVGSLVYAKNQKRLIQVYTMKKFFLISIDT